MKITKKDVYGYAMGTCAGISLYILGFGNENGTLLSEVLFKLIAIPFVILAFYFNKRMGRV